MRQIDHPNIVKLIEFSESRQHYYIVLELCPGGELFHQIVRLTYFSENLSRHVIYQVAQALLYCHEQAGVVHRYSILQSLPNISLIIIQGYQTRKYSFLPRPLHSYQKPKAKIRRRRGQGR